jgi:hypothetical protein
MSCVTTCTFNVVDILNFSITRSRTPIHASRLRTVYAVNERKESASQRNRADVSQLETVRSVKACLETSVVQSSCMLGCAYACPCTVYSIHSVLQVSVQVRQKDTCPDRRFEWVPPTSCGKKYNSSLFGTCRSARCDLPICH